MSLAGEDLTHRVPPVNVHSGIFFPGVSSYGGDQVFR